MFKLWFIKKSHQNVLLYNMTKINFKKYERRDFIRMERCRFQKLRIIKLKHQCQVQDVSLCTVCEAILISLPPQLQDTASYIGCPAEFNDKSLFLKTQHTFIIEHTDIMLELRWKLPPCWLIPQCQAGSWGRKATNDPCSCALSML